MNNRVVMLNNIPSPYCVDLFSFLADTYRDLEFHFIFTSRAEDNRNWKLEEGRLHNVTFLQSKVFKLKTAHDHRYIHFPANIKKELDRIDPAVVIAKEYNPSALQSLSWCKARKRKYIHVTEGTLYSERSLNFIQKASRKKIIRDADFCLGSGIKAKEKLLYWGAPEEKTDIALLTFNLAPFRNIGNDPKNGRLLYVGSLVERKGLDLLLRALPYVPSVNILHIVGGGSEEEKTNLVQLAEELKINDRIVWKGYREGEALLTEYREAQALVLPAREDCFGLVMLEAMAAGLPVIASEYADGAYDIVQDGRNGLIADPYVAKAFGEAIETVLSNPSYAENARNTDLGAFELDAVASVYYGAIQSVMKGDVS